MSTRHKTFVRAILLGGLCGLLGGCAFGDGRGFATIDGEFAVVMGDGEGGEANLVAVTVDIVQLQLEADHVDETGTEHVTSVLPIGLSWAPLAGEQPIPFGPYEVTGAQYSRIAVVVHGLVIKGTVDGEQFELEVRPEGGIEIESAADLPANRDELPLIHLHARLKVPPDLVAGVDFADKDAAALQVAKKLAEGAELSATWEREAD